MASELPDRELMQRYRNSRSLLRQYEAKVIRSYLDGKLQFRDEMDIAAASAVLQGDDLEVFSWEAWTETILDAAWGVTDE